MISCKTGDVDGNGNFISPTSSQFSTTCGCSTSSTGDTPVASTCDDGESFTVTSSFVPEVAGCYSDTGIDVEGAALYSETGTDNLQQIFVYSFDVGTSTSPDVSKREFHSSSPPCCYVIP